MPSPLKNSRKIALLSVLTALVLALQLSPRPPNVEFTSLFTFTVGFLFGLSVGSAFGGFVMFVNGFFSSWGFSGLNMPFQIIGMVFAGICGGLYRRFTEKMDISARSCLETATLGGFLALVYDLITNVGFGFQLVLAGADPMSGLLFALAYGSFFSLVHILSNALVFGTIFLPLQSALNNLRFGDMSWSKKERLYLQS